MEKKPWQDICAITALDYAMSILFRVVQITTSEDSEALKNLIYILQWPAVKSIFDDNDVLEQREKTFLCFSLMVHVTVYRHNIQKPFKQENDDSSCFSWGQWRNAVHGFSRFPNGRWQKFDDVKTVLALKFVTSNCPTVMRRSGILLYIENP